jgi:broad specificity phosphatase PhoE
MGHTDSPLTSEGIATVTSLVEVAGSEEIGAIFASSLGRASFTAALYSEGLGVPVHFSENMAELACGSWEGRPRWEVIHGSRRLRRTWEERPPGGESYQDAETRVTAFIEEILSVGFQSAVLVVGHAGVNRVFLKLLLGLDSATAVQVRFSHDSLYIIESEKGLLHRDAGGKQGTGLLFEPY